MHAAERSALGTSALVLGALSVAFVLLFRVVPAILTEFLLWITTDPVGTEAAAVTGTISEISIFLAFPVVPLLAVVLGFYLTASLDLPVVPAVAGSFLGAIVAPIGYVVATALVSPIELALLGPDAFGSFALTTVVYVVPVLLAVGFGGVLDDLRERGARLRGIGS